MPPTDLRGVAHQGGDLVEAYAFLGEFAAEGVAVVKAGPAEARLAVGVAEVGGEVVGVPPATGGAGEEPAGEALGRSGSGGGWRGIAVQELTEGPADRHGAVALGLGLPEARPLGEVDRFGLYANHAASTVRDRL